VVSTIFQYNIALLIISLHLTTVLMRRIIADWVAWCVCLSVGRLQPWALQKELNRSRRRLGCGLGWANLPPSLK